MLCVILCGPTSRRSTDDYCDLAPKQQYTIVNRILTRRGKDNGRTIYHADYNTLQTVFTCVLVYVQPPAALPEYYSNGQAVGLGAK